VFVARDQPHVHAPECETAEQFVAEHVTAHGGNELGGHALPVQVVTDVERGAAGVKAVGQEVPEDFPATEGGEGRHVQTPQPGR
jgi:hypothetical protein